MKEDAKALLGIGERNIIPVLRYWQSQLTKDNHEAIFADLKFMIVIINTYFNFKSTDVKYLTQVLLNKMIDNIYQSEDEEISLKSFQFMYSIIWQHRNVTKYSLLKNFEYKKELKESVKYNLLALGAIKSYQKVLF
jgi:hypothetical protein